MRQEDIIRKYFQAWLDKNIEPLKSIFSEPRPAVHVISWALTLILSRKKPISCLGS